MPKSNTRRWLSWVLGRRETGYYKMFLAGTSVASYTYKPRFVWDLYLLKFPPGSSAPEHSDEVPGYRHYRLNIILKRAIRGGGFTGEKILFRKWRINFFRSDAPHEVQKIEEGTRYVLSLGLVFRESTARKPADV